MLTSNDFVCRPQVIAKVNSAKRKELLNWWFSRYVIAAMLVDGKQKIAH